MATTKYTKNNKWASAAVHGNQIVCWEEGDKATCDWNNQLRNGDWKPVFVITSEKLKSGKFDNRIHMTDIGRNLIRGTDMEKQLQKPDGTGYEYIKID
jgi:hypothetical protein